MTSTSINLETIIEIIKNWRETAREYKSKETDEKMLKFYEGAEYITTCIIREVNHSDQLDIKR